MSSSLPCWRWRNRTAVYFISFELIASKQGCDVTGGGSWTFPWGQDNGFARGNPPTKWGGRFYVHLNFPKTSLAITNGHVFQVELRLSRWILWWVQVGVPASACPPPSTRSTWGWGTTTRTASLSISTRWSTALRRGYRQRKRCRTLLPTHQSYQFDLFWQVLVHCQAGMSRSPAVVAAFLVLKR